MEPANTSSGNAEVEVLPFDYSVENHFKAMDMIARLCGEDETGIDDPEIARLSSSIKFLREWRFFNYDPRVVKFSSETSTATDRNTLCSVTLPQFSSSSVPEDKKDEGSATAGQSLTVQSQWISKLHPFCNASPTTGPMLRRGKDFVMYAGGPVWALDWCPRVETRPDCHIKQEFIAVAAHPPGSPYHKLGCPLTGRGIVQIWSLLNVTRNDEEVPSAQRLKQKHKSAKPKGPRGRPRKKPLPVIPSDRNSNNDQLLEAHMIQCPEKTFELTATANEISETAKSPCKKGKSCDETSPVEISECVQLMEANEETRHSCMNQCTSGKNSTTQDMVVDDSSLDISPVVSFFPKDLALPRLALCLAHNGKVAWDVKWRPTYTKEESKYPGRMGYLAVLLGNGSLEVWEIPMLTTMKLIYSHMKKEGTDPRFVKMEPVFRCSKITSGGTQSIPLIVEWSPSSSQLEYLLAGCHDGTVALWKFSANGSPKELRISSLYRYQASALSLTITFRDPFRPLWDLHSASKIYSLDWPHDPRCIICSYDDGTLKFLGLSGTVNDLPVSGKPLVGTKQQGLHSFECSSFPNWSVHISRSTGMVAYSSADGTVCHFELTSKAVDKSHSRHRSPHFLCVSVTASEDGSAIILNSTPSDTPITLKKNKKVVDVEKRGNRRQKSEDQNSDGMPLALCYKGPEAESDETTTASLKSKRQKTQESAGSSKTVKPTDEEVGAEKRRGGADTGTETLPPKIVAMHRVRWNPNKGSERWLCSGGAAGILRCQEIRF